MESLYRFSPISDVKTIDESLAYIASQLEALSLELFDQQLPITTLKLFAHYQDEHEFLHQHIASLGEQAEFSSDTSYYVHVDQQVAGHDILYLGVRVVDPYRMQVGCGDFEIEHFGRFKEKYVGTSPYIRSFREDMIEVWHPNYDVLGYIIQKGWGI